MTAWGRGDEGYIEAYLTTIRQESSLERYYAARAALQIGFSMRRGGISAGGFLF